MHLIKIQVMSAIDKMPIQDVKLHRTMALIKDESFENPVVLDFFRIDLIKKINMIYPIISLVT